LVRVTAAFFSACSLIQAKIFASDSTSPANDDRVMLVDSIDLTKQSEGQNGRNGRRASTAQLRFQFCVPDVPRSRDRAFDEREIVVRDIPHLAAEQKGLSHRDNFGGWVPRVQQVVSPAQRDRVLPEMSVTIRVAGAKSDIETSSLQEVAYEEKQN
jgi:hypothetical protein